jgi:hypothetical protein
MPTMLWEVSVISGLPLAIAVLLAAAHLNQSMTIHFNQLMLVYTHVKLLTVLVTLEVIAQK